MTINPHDLTALTATGTTAASSTATATTATANTSHKGVDSNTFLTLLIAQLKHQDPLEPQQGAEFVAQLAQFNALEQLTSINNGINQLLHLQKPPTQTQQAKAALGIVPLPAA